MWSDNLVFGCYNSPLFYFIHIFWVYCFMVANTMSLPTPTVKFIENFPEVVVEELNSFSFILCSAGCFPSLQKISWKSSLWYSWGWRSVDFQPLLFFLSSLLFSCTIKEGSACHCKVSFPFFCYSFHNLSSGMFIERLLLVLFYW